MEAAVDEGNKGKVFGGKVLKYTGEDLKLGMSSDIIPAYSYYIKGEMYAHLVGQSLKEGL